jgi:hypothetical protein
VRPLALNKKEIKSKAGLSVFNRVVRKLQFSQAEPSLGLITKTRLGSVNFRLKNAKCVAFCKTWATTNQGERTNPMFNPRCNFCVKGVIFRELCRILRVF